MGLHHFIYISCSTQGFSVKLMFSSFLSPAFARLAAHANIAGEFSLSFNHSAAHDSRDSWPNSHRFSKGIRTYASTAASVFNRVVGVPDRAAAFSTVFRESKHIDNRRDFNAGPIKWTRTSEKSDGQDTTAITFAFDDDFGIGINGISADRAKELFIEALQTWANYAPIDFQEIKDPDAGNEVKNPGVGNLVDIYVQSDGIDGRSGTLAFAYFPTVGDITFDTGEVWSESMFLETAVHELGHSLGLDHEDDTEAIMNSKLGRRFSNKSFLLEDDINGIRSLYGEGKGGVTLLDGTTFISKGGTGEGNPPAPVPAINLVTNGSFEDVPLEVGESKVYTSVKGWSTISGAGFQVDRRPDLGGKTADGTAWVELDTFNQNGTIGQNIDTITGQTYDVSVSFSSGGRPDSTASVQIFWEGKKVDTLTGGGKGQWRRFDYQLQGGDRSVSTLAFRAIGPSDNIGGFIDDIVVAQAKAAVVEAVPEEAVEQVLGTSSQPEFHRDPISGDRNNLVADTSLFDQHDHSAHSTFV